MPYPPPPGPPDVGEFQAIGKLPAPQLPDVTGHGGDFLETDGVIPQWEPVTGVLPDQTGHSGQFLTTDGATASWAPGGGGVTTVGALTTPTADAAVIIGTTLQLAPADATNPGVLSTGTQAAAGLKLFGDGAAVASYDIRNVLGALPNDNTYDISTAWYTVTESWTQNANRPPVLPGQKTGQLYLPQGDWYTSMPLIAPGSCYIFGDGYLNTVINAGVGTSATPSIVQGFAGPLIYNGALIPDPGTYPWTPTYNAGLHVGGQSLALTPAMAPLFLHDSYPWSWYLGAKQTSQSLCLHIEYKIPNTAVPSTALLAPIIGTRGPDIWGDTSKFPYTADICVGLYVTSDGSDFFIKAFLTTQPAWTVGTFSQQKFGVQQSITSSAVTVNTVLDIELDYNGAFFDLYVNGVNQGHLTQTGPLCKAPWESATIGPAPGGEYDPTSGGIHLPIESSLGSIELAQVARHTGTSSYTPSPGPFVADADTLWLCNWDKGQMPVAPVGAKHLPFVLAETVIATGNFNADTTPPTLSDGLHMVPHYIRIIAGGSDQTHMSGLQIACKQNCSGVVLDASSRSIFRDIAVTFPAHFGFKAADGGSFYTDMLDCSAWWGSDIGILWLGQCIRPNVQACPIGIQLYVGGNIDTAFIQPTWASYAPMLIGPGGTDVSPIQISQSSNDAEVWTFYRQLAPLVMIDCGAPVVTQSNVFDAGTSFGPPVYILGNPPGSWTSINDSYNPSVNSGARLVASTLEFTVNGGIQLINPVGVWDTVSLPNWTFENYASLLMSTGNTNVQGISTTDSAANNLAGVFTIAAGFTSGGPTFITPESDDDYVVNINYKGFNGSAPAAGSTVPGPYVTHTNGFVMTQGIDPGVGSQTVWSYTIVKTQTKPIYFDFTPSVPSTVANPLLPSHATGQWAAGVTLMPVFGNVFPWNQSLGNQTVLNAGTTPSGTDWWELYLQAGGAAGTAFAAGATAENPDSFVSNGQLCGLMNPGPHNLVVGCIAGGMVLYCDGNPLPRLAGSAGTQQTPVYVGERFDTSQALTVATLKNLKIDTKASLCITIEQDSGPGAMAQAAIFGDTWTMGYESTSNNGGAATQVASNRYGTTYYWLAAKNQEQIVERAFAPGLIKDLWIPWGQNQTTLVGAMVMAGWYDLLVGPSGGTGNTAANVWAALLPMLDGDAATATFIPPTSNTFAWAGFVPPVTATATCVLDGITFTCTVVPGDYLTTVNNLIALVQANVTVNALVNVSARSRAPNVPDYFMYVEAKVPGTAGNMTCPCATNNANGAYFYTGFPSTDNLSMGADTTCVINGISVVANFDTDANTTVNNLIAAIAADGTLNALVTGSLVSGQMLLTANTVGTAGNAITLSGNGLNSPPTAPWGTAVHTMSGGINGLVTPNAIPAIVLCTVPPFGTATGYTAGKDAERVTFNGLVAAYAAAHVADGVVVADVDVTLRDAGAHQNLNPAYDNGAGFLNDAGHTALFGLINPLLP